MNFNFGKEKPLTIEAVAASRVKKLNALNDSIVAEESFSNISNKMDEAICVTENIEIAKSIIDKFGVTDQVKKIIDSDGSLKDACKGEMTTSSVNAVLDNSAKEAIEGFADAFKNFFSNIKNAIDHSFAIELDGVESDDLLNVGQSQLSVSVIDDNGAARKQLLVIGILIRAGLSGTGSIDGRRLTQNINQIPADINDVEYQNIINSVSKLRQSWINIAWANVGDKSEDHPSYPKCDMVVCVPSEKGYNYGESTELLNNMKKLDPEVQQATTRMKETIGQVESIISNIKQDSGTVNKKLFAAMRLAKIYSEALSYIIEARNKLVKTILNLAKASNSVKKAEREQGRQVSFI